MRRAAAAVVPGALVLAGLLLGGGAAGAVWSVSGPGATAARAGVLAAPTDLAPGPLSCGLVTASVPLSWSAAAGAVSYQVDTASNASFTADLRQSATTATTTTYSDASLLRSTRTFYVRVRAVAGPWVSPSSTTLRATVGPCLL